MVGGKHLFRTVVFLGQEKEKGVLPFIGLQGSFGHGVDMQFF
jgi:hypothetical protein